MSLKNQTIHLLRVSLTILLIATLLSSNAYCLSLSLPRPTVALQPGQTAPYAGYLIDPSRLEKSILCVQDVQSWESKYKLDTEYLVNKCTENLNARDLEIKKIVEQDKFVIKGLSEELAKKSVWYRQPWAVATFTVLAIVGTGFALKK